MAAVEGHSGERTSYVGDTQGLSGSAGPKNLQIHGISWNIPIGLDYICWLVVWNMVLIFPYIGNFIMPTDELIFFRGVGQPPTSLRIQFVNSWDTHPSRIK